MLLARVWIIMLSETKNQTKPEFLLFLKEFPAAFQCHSDDLKMKKGHKKERKKKVFFPVAFNHT